jgi:hypothetical protein
MLEMVAFSGQMLDAGYLMLDIQECTNSEIEKHPVSRIQDQSILAMVFVSTAYIECNILCNYRG